MKTFLTRPNTQSILRQAAAYALFLVFATAALLLTMRLRENVLELSMLLNSPAWLFRILYSWGTFILFLPYIFLVVVIEAYLTRGAKINQLRPRALRVLLIEVGLGAASYLFSWIVVRLIR